MEAEESRYEGSVSRLSTIGPIAGLVAILIAVFSDLPPIVQYIMVFLLALLTAVSAYVACGKLFIQLLKRIRQKTKDHFLVTRHFKTFDKFLARLEELFQPRRCDNIPYVSDELQTRYPELCGVSPRLDDFADLVAVLRSARIRLRRNKGNLCLIIRWFESILYVYHKHLICIPIERIKHLKGGEIHEEIRKRYAEAAAVYKRFIQDYTLFAKELNMEFQERVATRDYFQMPEALYK